ncbi:hypothetical protein M0802_015487 [Mischocyttarus mexicanus]|nr:hypothetical protein M0802_015487 [Mischocyttarus mexicanus]
MRILRWRLKLSEYEYDVVYKAGKTNINADALSRNPVEVPQTTCHVVHGQRNLANNPDKILELLNESDDDIEDRTHDYYRDDIPDLSELKDDERMVAEDAAALLTPKNPIKKLIADPKPAEPNHIDDDIINSKESDGWRPRESGRKKRPQKIENYSDEEESEAGTDSEPDSELTLELPEKKFSYI